MNFTILTSEMENKIKTLSEGPFKCALINEKEQIIMTYTELWFVAEKAGFNPPKYQSLDEDDEMTNFFMKIALINHINSKAATASRIEKRIFSTALSDKVRKEELYEKDIKEFQFTQFVSTYDNIIKVPLFCQLTLKPSLEAVSTNQFQELKKLMNLEMTQEAWITRFPTFPVEEIIQLCVLIYKTFPKSTANLSEEMALHLKNDYLRENPNIDDEENVPVSKKTNTSLPNTSNANENTLHAQPTMLSDHSNQINKESDKVSSSHVPTVQENTRNYQATKIANDIQYNQDYPNNLATNNFPQHNEENQFEDNTAPYRNAAMEPLAPLVNAIIDGNTIITIDMESINPKLYVQLKELFSSIKTLAPNSIDSDTFEITETKWLTDNTLYREKIVKRILTMQYDKLKKGPPLLKQQIINNQYETIGLSDEYYNVTGRVIQIFGITEMVLKGESFGTLISKALEAYPILIEDVLKFVSAPLKYPKHVAEIVDGLPVAYYMMFRTDSLITTQDEYRLINAGETKFIKTKKDKDNIKFHTWLGINIRSETMEDIHNNEKNTAIIAVVRGFTKEEANSIPLLTSVFQPLLPGISFKIIGQPVLDTFYIRGESNEKKKTTHIIQYFIINAVNITETQLKQCRTATCSSTKKPRIIQIGNRHLEVWPDVDSSRGKAPDPNVSNTPFAFHIPRALHVSAMDIFGLLEESEQQAVERIIVQPITMYGAIEKLCEIFIIKKTMMGNFFMIKDSLNSIKPMSVPTIEPRLYQLGKDQPIQNQTPAKNFFCITEADMYQNPTDKITEQLTNLRIADGPKQTNNNLAASDGFQQVRNKKTKTQR